MSKPDELKEWESTLSEFEQRLSNAHSEADKETWQHMCEFCTSKILSIEKEVYGLNGKSR